jgi:hypothetical protein
MKKHNLDFIYKKYSEKELENNIHLFGFYDWRYISKYQILSEEFIEKHSNKLNWDNISAYQVLSEDFIEKHLDKLNWYEISFYHKLSEEFIKKHIDKINIYWLMENKNISEKIKEEIKTLEYII